MRRAAAVVLGTITGTVLLVGAKVGNAPLDVNATGDDNTGVVVAPGITPAPGTAKSGDKATTTPGGKPATTGPGGSKAPTGTTTPGKTPSPTKTTSSPTPSGYTDGSYQVTEAVAHNYGTLSMTVTISGGKITNISASETKSSSYCNRYCPTLEQEALVAQNANIKVLRGQATYTSEAYIAGLQAVLAHA